MGRDHEFHPLSPLHLPYGNTAILARILSEQYNAFSYDHGCLLHLCHLCRRRAWRGRTSSSPPSESSSSSSSSSSSWSFSLRSSRPLHRRSPGRKLPRIGTPRRAWLRWIPPGTARVDARRAPHRALACRAWDTRFVGLLAILPPGSLLSSSLSPALDADRDRIDRSLPSSPPEDSLLQDASSSSSSSNTADLKELPLPSLPFPLLGALTRPCPPRLPPLPPLPSLSPPPYPSERSDPPLDPESESSDDPSPRSPLLPPLSPSPPLAPLPPLPRRVACLPTALLPPLPLR